MLVRKIVHREYGTPADVLELSSGELSPALPPGKALVRILLVPIHPGDILSIEGSPAYGPRLPITDDGRVPGLEAFGIVEDLAADLEDSETLKRGMRVAVFPAEGTWSERIVVDATSLTPVPDGVSDEIAAQTMINPITAMTLVRSLQAGLPGGYVQEDVVLLTAASSSVGRLTSLELERKGVRQVRLVRSEASGAKLQSLVPAGLTIVTGETGWQERLLDSLGGVRPHAAIDGVGGKLLGEVASLLQEGGLIVNYGSLGGIDTDIRAIVPGKLTIRGVSLGSWVSGDIKERAADLHHALGIAASRPDLFPTGKVVSAKDFRSAFDPRDGAGGGGMTLIRLD